MTQHWKEDLHNHTRKNGPTPTFLANDKCLSSRQPTTIIMLGTIRKIRQENPFFRRHTSNKLFLCSKAETIFILNTLFYDYTREKRGAYFILDQRKPVNSFLSYFFRTFFPSPSRRNFLPVVKTRDFYQQQLYKFFRPRPFLVALHLFFCRDFG